MDTESDLQMGEDMQRKTRSQDFDCSMVTLFQPQHMLKNEMLLHEAARTNSINDVRKLIGEKTNVNSRNNLDRTPLHWAAANGHLDIVKVLLRVGGDMEAEDKYGMRAVHWAAWFGHLAVLKVLVNNGAQIECTNKKCLLGARIAISVYGDNPQQGMNILMCAAQNSHIDIIQYIVDILENFPLNHTEKHEKTALHLAAENAHQEAVDKLLEINCDQRKQDEVGQTPLHLAALYGHQEVVERLLGGNSGPDDKEKVEEEREQRKVNEEEKLNVNVKDKEGRTPLYLAAEKGHAKVVEILLTWEADPNCKTTKDQNSLHVAALHGHVGVVAILLQNGCNVNAQNYQGNTALHLAAINNHPQVLRQLLDGDSDTEAQNQRLQTPLHVSVENGLADVVEVLLIAGANIEAKERTHKTPLSLASRGSFIGIVDMIIKADRHNQAQQLWQQQAPADVEKHSNNDVQFKRPNHECTEFMKDILWKLATRQLKQTDWKKLAYLWQFNDSHIKAIEHQYTGPNSYKEHGYRLLLIWLHGVKKEDNPMKHLFESLAAIDRKELAESIRKKCNVQVEKTGSPRYCLVS